MLIESQTVFDNTVTFSPGTPLVSQGPVTLNTINGGGTVPTIATVTAGAGVGSTATLKVGHDVGGSFVLTAAGTPAAGPIATVTFGTPLTAAPVSVVVSAVDTTGSPLLVVNVGAGAFATTGFSIVGPALTAAHTYLISYQVVAS
jgi:hypothetical protein